MKTAAAAVPEELVQMEDTSSGKMVEDWRNTHRQTHTRARSHIHPSQMFRLRWENKTFWSFQKIFTFY